MCCQMRSGAVGIGSGVHYPVPVHLQKAYRDLALGEGSFPVAERLARRHYRCRCMRSCGRNKSKPYAGSYEGLRPQRLQSRDRGDVGNR